MNIREILKYGKEYLKENKIEDANIIGRILLEYVLDKDKQYFVIHDNELVEEQKQNIYEEYLELIVKGKPIQYITNNQEFMKMQFYVDENVLIPQPDTEILVEEVLDICNKIKKNNKEIKVLDMCTGSGAIGISIAKYLKDAHVTLVDISDDAINIAEKNAINNDVIDRIKIIHSDMFDNINYKYDIIVSNPPYIETNIIRSLSKTVQNEPNIALDGGKDGLDFYKILAQKSYKYLKDNGYLCLEIGYNQRNIVMELIEKTEKYTNIYSKKDLSNNDRIVIASKKD